MQLGTLLVTLLAWTAVGCFWLITTRDSHPTWTLAGIVTTSLVVAYAGAAYVNHLILIPRNWRSRQFGRYAGWLGVTMVLPTAAALVVIRVAYFNLWGLDPDPNGAPKHFAIDLFGMAVHLVGAAIVVWAAGRYRPATGLAGA